MKKFNANRELTKLMTKKNPKLRILLALLCFEIIALIGVSYAFYQSNDSKTLVAGTVGTFTQDDIKFKVYLNDVLTDSFPASDEGYTYSRAVCNNNSPATWDNNNWQLNVVLSQPDICQIYFIN